MGAAGRRRRAATLSTEGSVEPARWMPLRNSGGPCRLLTGSPVWDHHAQPDIGFYIDPSGAFAGVGHCRMVRKLRPRIQDLSSCESSRLSRM